MRHGLRRPQIDLETRRAVLGGHELAEGDVVTIDGGTGAVIVGRVDLVPPQINDDFGTILGWADDARRLRVRANADTPADAAKARELGAQGIGLCRTEHMFNAEDRLPVVREMIMAANEPDRRSALDRLLPMQQADFEGILEAMQGLPVTIRLLDPPLHEFLPQLEDAASDAMRERIKQLREANPMLGTRGCRLGLMYPEIYEMQVRASCGPRSRSSSGRARRRSSRSCTRWSRSTRSCAGSVELTLAVAAEEGAGSSSSSAR